MIAAFIDSVRLAVGTLFSNAVRSLLTLLGIVLGVATVIAMMGLIEGLRVNMNNEFSFLGASTFTVSKWPSGIHFHVDWSKIRRRPNLTLADARAIRANCPSVEAVSAGTMTGGKRVTSATASTDPDVRVSGDTAEINLTGGVAVARGRSFGKIDVEGGQRVAVLGPDVATALFGSEDPLGREIRLVGRPFRVIGVYKRRGTLLGRINLDELVEIPLSSFEEVYGAHHWLELQIKARSRALLAKAQDEVTAVMRARHHLRPQDDNDFDIGTNASMTSAFNKLSVAVSAAGFAICLLSLVVGGIGILNIMLVSVSERTQEIGIRKALGATRRRILAQFTIEAVVLSLVGGLLGLGLGYGVSFLAHWTVGFPVAVPLWAVWLSLGVSSVVGLLFGIYPAAHASRLDPVEAMRAE